MKIDLRKSRSTMVDHETLDNEFVFDNEKNIFAFLSKIDLKVLFSTFLRLVLCGVGTIALMQVERRNIEKLNIQKQSAHNEYNQLKGVMEDLKKQVEGFASLKERSKEFTNKLGIMEGMVQKRLKVIRGLDQIQDVIPKNIWLERVNFNGDHLVLEGFSMTNRQVQGFIESMESTNIFSRVVLDKLSEQGASRQKRFSIDVTLR